MTRPWLTIIGMGEDGPDGLGDASRLALQSAQVVFGGRRHLSLANAGTRGRPWPVPFDLSALLACKPDPVVVLASGDPFWFGVGGTLSRHLSADEYRVLPAAGCFSLAAARMGWPIERTRCVGLHASDLATLRPLLARDCRILATMRNGASPAQLAEWLTDQGFGAMKLCIMESLGGPAERLHHCIAQDFDRDDLADLVVVALDGSPLARTAGLSTVPGRPENIFAHDGQITRSPIRAMTLAALAPRAGELLWDLGGGSGAVSIEWGLAGGRAICVENRATRIANIRQNIHDFGLSRRITARHDDATACLEELPVPDAVFLGGGATAALLDRLWNQMPGGARLVCNAVTLETEALLMARHAALGGDLIRTQLEFAAPLGSKRGWQPARSVTQWSVTR